MIQDDYNPYLDPNNKPAYIVEDANSNKMCTCRPSTNNRIKTPGISRKSIRKCRKLKV